MAIAIFRTTVKRLLSVATSVIRVRGVLKMTPRG